MFRQTSNWIGGCVAAISAFLRAYDSDVAIDEAGLPTLRAWASTPSPYLSFLDRSPQLGGDSAPRAALVFTHSGHIENICYLQDRTYTLGSGCHNDIVLSHGEASTARMTLIVSAEGAIVSSDQVSQPVRINGHVVQFDKLVDQDECRFGANRFHFIQMAGSQ